MKQYNTNPEFHKFVDLIEEGSTRGLTGLNSLRQATLTRVPRYILLLGEMIKKTDPQSEEYQKLVETKNDYGELGVRVNTFLKQSSDYAKVVTLNEKFGSRGRAMLAPSQVLDPNSHRWKKRRVGSPILCACCNALITSTTSARQCAKCSLVVHTKNCRGMIETQCAQGTLMEHGRKYMAQYEVLHSCMVVVGRRESRKSDDRRATMVLFNDSLLLYYGEESEPILVALVRWYSRTKGEFITIRDSSPHSITVCSPRDHRIHFLTFTEEMQKKEVFHQLQDLVQKWTDNNESLIASTAVEEIESDVALSSMDPNKIQVKIELTVPVQDFTAYVIEVQENWHTTTIIKRYSEFYTLHKSLRCIYSKKDMPEMPSKRRLRNNTSVNFVKRRCVNLQNYLNNLLKLPDIETIPEFQHFMQTTLANSGDVQPTLPSTEMRDDESDDSYELSEEGESTTDPTSASSIDSDPEFMVESPRLEVGIVRYDFEPEDGTRGLQVKEGEDVLILAKQTSSWWYCRTEDNRTGYVPSNYLQTWEPSYRTLPHLKPTE